MCPLQLRVFGFGVFQDGNIGVSVLPQREELLIRRARRVSRAGKSQSRYSLDDKCGIDVQRRSGARIHLIPLVDFGDIACPKYI